MNINRNLVIVSIVLLLAAIGVSVQAQSVEPDRTSFFNVPSHSGKFRADIDYADGSEERRSFGTCAPQTITVPLNVYTAQFNVDSCSADTFQQLNLRWLGGCLFDHAHDPDDRITFYGAYGQVVITGHYDQGQVTLPVPTGTISMTAIMSHTEGIELWMGNVTFLFDEPQGCVDAPATVTPTATDTPTAAPTEIVVVNDATPTPTEVVIVCCPSTPVTMTPTATATDMPTPTPTPTEVISGQQPTDEDTTEEPQPQRVYLAVVVK